MIEILCKSQIKEIKNEEFRNYLEYSFSRLPVDYKYPEYGYFILIESIKDLESNPIKLSTSTLPNIENGLFDDVELVEIQNEIMEVVILYGNDFGVSLILPIKILEDTHKERLKSYIY